MSFTLEQAVARIWLNDYAGLMVLTVLGYDYILTLSDEVEYIWNKPWTRVSTLFILVRYFGLPSVAIYVILGTIFLPGPEKVISHPTDDPQIFQPLLDVFILHLALLSDISDQPIIFICYSYSCNILYIVSNWAVTIFLFAADLAMILRVWALYGQSRLVLGTLLTLYTFQIIPVLIYGIMLSIQDGPIEVTSQVLNSSLCVQKYDDSPILLEVIDTAQIMLGASMCLLFIVQLVREVFQMFKTTRHFHLNRYMNLLIREGVIYFLVMMTRALLNVLLFSGRISMERWRIIVLGGLYDLPPFTLAPRFILSLRKLYAHNIGGGHGNEIDTAFGFSLAAGSGSAADEIMFADVVHDGEEQDEEMQTEEMENRDVGSSGTC